MPPPRPVKEECVLQTRQEAWMEVWRRYVGKECRARGSQEHNQLTKQEIAGKVSLLKRVNAGEIHVSPSDKGKGMVVMPTEMFHKMCSSHLKDDTKVG